MLILADPQNLPYCLVQQRVQPTQVIFFQIVQMLSLISFNFTRLFPMADILRATPGYASHPKKINLLNAQYCMENVLKKSAYTNFRCTGRIIRLCAVAKEV